MPRATRETMWTLGLDQDDADAVRQAAGDEFLVREIESPGAVAAENLTVEPLVIWTTRAAWEALPPLVKCGLESREGVQRVLVLSPVEAVEGWEDLAGRGFLTALKSPLAAARVSEVCYRAAEIRSLYADIVRMTREIFLERELLTRKTDQLVFFNRILSRASESLDPAVILARAREDMGLLFPVRAIQAVFWEAGEGGGVDCSLCLCRSEPAVREAWVEFLLEAATRLSGHSVAAYQPEETVCEGRQESPLGPPEPGTTVLLPLRAGRETFGCLALSATEPVRLGKDQIQTVHAAVNHLALALKNARLYREARTHADYDGLTRIHNRRSFDARLMEELKRHQRHSHELSLLMLDLDHFKGLNDRLGHQAGDHVLRTVGQILARTVRTTDFAARYGGEEFVVILPQTSEDQAWVLAERLRRIIGSHVFGFGGETFQVTASIGIASLIPGALRKVGELVGEADRALYLAKSSGRNMVCASGQPQSPAQL